MTLEIVKSFVYSDTSIGLHHSIHQKNNLRSTSSRPAEFGDDNRARTSQSSLQLISSQNMLDEENSNMIDPISVIVTALTLGAAAGLKPTAEQAIKDAYGGLRRLIVDRYQTARTGVDLIETEPDSETFQETARKLLAKTEAGQDEELLRQARTVVQTVEQLAPETAAKINIKLSDIKAAANFRIADLAASGGIDINVKKATAGQDFEIKGLRATGGDIPEPKK